tara:strand:- start:64 stop:321 length:258 start_codon:yes stop_codon:yes gene_type:complete
MSASTGFSFFIVLIAVISLMNFLFTFDLRSGMFYKPALVKILGMEVIFLNPLTCTFSLITLGPAILLIPVISFVALSSSIFELVD